MKFLSLLCGIVSFIIAIYFGHDFGWKLCERRNRHNRYGLMRGLAHYRIDFIVNLFIGFAVQIIVWRLAGLIIFLPVWLSILVLLVLLTAACGFLYGIGLGYVRVYRGSNRKCSDVPSILGELAGMAVYVIFFL